MPDLSSDAAHVAARSGQPFGMSGVGIAGADAPEEPSALGDYPESMYLKKPRGFWHHDEQGAVREAKESGRGLLVSFWASWCDVCRRLDDDTLRAPEVRAAIYGSFVPLRIDVSEETRLGRVLLERYRVDHVPAIIVLDDDGRERDRLDHYVSEDVMLERIARAKLAPGDATNDARR